MLKAHCLSPFRIRTYERVVSGAIPAAVWQNATSKICTTHKNMLASGAETVVSTAWLESLLINRVFPPMRSPLVQYRKAATREPRNQRESVSETQYKGIRR